MIFKNFQSRLLTSFFLSIVVFTIFISNFFLVYFLLILSVLSWLEFSNLIARFIKIKIFKIFFNILFLIYLIIFCLLFFYFSKILVTKFLLFSILLGCIGSDIGGYIVGNLIKGPKLTKISPKKTISGAIGSIVFSTSLIFISIYYYLNYFSFNVILIGILTSIACQSGDLFFSYLKRKSRVKDTGNFLPGHGGILDRLDGIFLGVPVGIILFIYLI